MNQQKGFSLIEVLVSLMLMTTVALTLLYQQGDMQHMLHRMELQLNALQQQDQANEELHAEFKS